jgi:hypothetical protein
MLQRQRKHSHLVQQLKIRESTGLHADLTQLV